MSVASRDEMMTVAAARLLHDGDVCFVGIGLPSAACNLARCTHAPNIGHVRAAIGWPLIVAEHLATIALPSAQELDALRALNARTEKAHAQPVKVPQ